jgi:hypothetical protein
MEALDTQFVKFQHPLEYGLRTADKTAGISLVGVKYGEPVIFGSPHAARAGKAFYEIFRATPLLPTIQASYCFKSIA